MLPKIGDRIELLNMPDDPCPIEPGTTGTVRNVTGPFRFGPGGRESWQVSVDWDTQRSLLLSVPPDTFRVIEECEFEQRNPHEWYCRVHDRLLIAGTQEPVSCGKEEA